MVFLSTTGDLLDPGQQAALERWLQSSDGSRVGAAGSASTGPPTPSTVAESTYTGGGMRTDHPIA